MLVGPQKERCDVKVALSNSFGFGGHNSSILFAPFKWQLAILLRWLLVTHCWKMGSYIRDYQAQQHLLYCKIRKKSESLVGYMLPHNRRKIATGFICNSKSKNYVELEEHPFRCHLYPFSAFYFAKLSDANCMCPIGRPLLGAAFSVLPDRYSALLTDSWNTYCLGLYFPPVDMSLVGAGHAAAVVFYSVLIHSLLAAAIPRDVNEFAWVL